MSHYPAILEADDGAFGVWFPDLPGCVAMGKTQDSALMNANSALSDWVRTMEVKGFPIAPPTEVDELMKNPDVADSVREGSICMLVPLIREACRQVKTNLSLDAGIVAAIDATAQRLGQTRSATVEILARRYLAELT